MVVPLAKIAGCRVIGIAGGSAKCKFVTEVLGADIAVDYREEQFEQRLREASPNGIDIYFDNVGGKLLDICVGQIALRGRVVMCGRISEYVEGPISGLVNYYRIGEQNARMEGFFIYDYADRFGDAEAELAKWFRAGLLPVAEDMLVGLERMPEALIRLYERDNTGKQVVRIATLDSAHDQFTFPEEGR